ncbi:hypothetical protein MSG28_010928 [Choristoneura fumiferana]|uniref:Uncharacterized protein n=1 Tax=Choristoneura fumiferana TaxID=7141 RepID=A0ACC0KPK7_CHOFU|nr:hypothetical protein MSG28_010928 [Choristoneura fumiferana]
MGEVSTMAALFILVSLSFASVLGESPVVDAATCTKLHEQYIDCLAGQCSPKTCDDLGRPIACPFIVGPCPGGCICEEGYLRNSEGACIKIEQCPPKCTKPNEKYIDCLAGQCQPKTCKELQAPAPCPRVKPPCSGGCICIDGFVRDDSGACIKKENCPIICNGPNEQNSTCANKQCTPSTCKEVVKMPYCPPPNPGPCTIGCICKNGFVRNSNGTCVAIKDCPEAGNCASKNETWVQCAANCAPAYCPTNDQPQPNCFLPVGACQPGCHCKLNYRINKYNQCILASECPNQCKKPNERYSDCLLGECVPKTCDDLGKPIACPDVAGPCGGGCICTKGFVRNSNGDCIDKLTCPSCGGDPNAQSGCGNPCGKTCDSRGVNKSELICPQYCNTNGCDCRPGFLLDTDAKKCVPEKSCPKSSQCKGRNEVYSSCPAGQCGPKTCDNLINPAPCPRVIPPCPGGCICQEGYLRDSNGTCIEKNKCPKQCKKPNERYTDCLLGECVPKTCDDLGKPIACATVAAPCAGGCICAEGFVRNKNGDCIDKFKCPSCGGDPNAQSGCSNPCGKTCASRAPNVAQIACPLYCEYNGCDCKKGFLLDTDSNKCVPENSCPKPSQPQCKGPHEVYNSCPIGQCGPKTCDNLINPPPCPRIIPPCPGGCICKEGYLRDSNGICIEKNKCPQLACSSNQTYVSCSVNCPDKYCPENDQPQPVCDPPRNCPPGCTCKINYKLNKSGQCILASECPPINCTRQNEEYNSCPSDCSTDRCEDADTPPAVCNTLLLNCQPKCVCKKNHYRNQDGLCVPAKDCRKLPHPVVYRY